MDSRSEDVFPEMILQGLLGRNYLLAQAEDG